MTIYETVQANFDKAGVLLTQYQRAVTAYEEKLQEIEALNSKYRSTVLADMRRTALQELQQVGIGVQSKLEEALGAIQSGLDEKESSIDYMQDEQFVNFLRLMELTDGKLPPATFTAINEAYKTNVQALYALRGVYEASLGHGNGIDELLASRMDGVRTICDAVYYTLPVGSTNARYLASDIGRLAEENGFTFNFPAAAPEA